MLLAFAHIPNNLITTCTMMIIHSLTLHFDTALNDLDLQSRLQLYEKAKTSLLVFSQISQLDEIQNGAKTTLLIFSQICQTTSKKFRKLKQLVDLLKLMPN